MKRQLLTIALFTVQIVVIAQTVNIHLKNGQQIQYSASNIDYVDFSEKAADPTVSAGQVVDLGLTVYWASCNLGAEAPEEYGDYFAWGETKPKRIYTEENYSYYDTSSYQYTDIGENIAGTPYDAATVNLGNDWRMPTRQEIKELIDNCTWEWTTISNINGYKITGKNGNSIFLPAAGRIIYASLSEINRDLQYSTATSATPTEQYILVQNQGYPGSYTIIASRKYDGLSIRPVTTNINAGGTPIDHSQDYLVTDKISASFTGGAYSQINGQIQLGSVLNVKFTNGSSEAVTLVAVQIYDSGSSNMGNNVLESEVEIGAGESKAYGLRLGKNMTTPVVRFTYRYNKKKYIVEATWT